MPSVLFRLSFGLRECAPRAAAKSAIAVIMTRRRAADFDLPVRSATGSWAFWMEAARCVLNQDQSQHASGVRERTTRTHDDGGCR
jgi:hypothetical protein